MELTGKATSWDFGWAAEHDENGTTGLQAVVLLGVECLIASCLSAVFNASHM